MTDAAYKANYLKIDWRPLPPVEKPIRHRGALADFPCPMVIRDNIDGLQSMADGRVYDSKSALRRSYTSDGNPQGRDYQEIGGAEIEPAGRASVDKKAVRDAVDKAMYQVESGDIPESIRNIE